MEMNFSPNVVVSKVVITDPGSYFHNTEYSVTLKNVLSYKTKKFKFFSAPGNRTWKFDYWYSGYWSKYVKHGQSVINSLHTNLKPVEKCNIEHQKNQQQVLDEFVNVTDPPKFDLESFRYCLFSDAQCGMLTFSEFCNECGYDTDSRQVYKIHKTCIKTLEKLLELGVSRKTIEEF
jgi:hypothetical protein